MADAINSLNIGIYLFHTENLEASIHIKNPANKECTSTAVYMSTNANDGTI
jgi:hypothetical protein